ncbi:MAG: Ig-like domain-containing protein, partial [Candidatus Saliniplasma sp.]
MKYKQLAITLIFLISFAVPITSVQAENEIKPFEISPPSEFDIEENDRDLLLGWESVDKAEEYKVYWSDDRAAQFPMEWNAETIMDTTWTHEGALDTDESIFYLVRGVNGTIEGELSHMGYKAEMDLLNRKDERSWNWLSLPYHVMDYNNDDEYTAMDLVEMIEGDRESSDIINSVARYNNSKPYESPKYDPYYNPSYYPIMNYTEDGWKIEDDFKIRIGDAIGLNTTANYTWNLCGVEDLNIDINIYDHSRQYVSIPYTTHDINQDGKIGTFDIVKDIEGNFSSSDYISTVFDWDASGQGFTNTTSYDAISGLWYDEFYFKPGDCASFHVRKDFTWKPFKTVHQPPMINNVIQNTSSVALDSSLTIEFTEKMNRTSLETNIDSNDFDLSLEWINNHTLEINPNQKFRPETEYALIITHLAKDIYGNYLDGDLNGIANRTDQDDYVLTFTSETYPMIEHDSPETWHIRDDIELSANITDDEGLENAYINYTQVDGIQHNVSLDVDNSTISIPAQNQTGTFSYYYWAVDESGLSNRSETFSIELLDLDDPYVMNVSQDSDVLSIYGNFTLEFSKPMNGTSVEDGLVIKPDLNYDLTQIDEYRFEVNITAVPNQQYSINLDSQVVEDELGINLDSDFNTTFNTETSPDIVYEQEVFSIHKDSNISFSVECIDDFGVDNVQIEGTGPNGYTFAENLSDT